MKKKLFLTLIILQLIIATFLISRIYLKRKNILGVVNINPISKNLFTTSPSGVLKNCYEPKPNSLSSDNEWVNLFPGGIYKTNSDSLRENSEYPIKRASNSFRIITLGDSFTWGLFVDVKDIWPKQLEISLNSLSCKNISKFEVVNLGTAGYDLRYSLERYRLRGKKYDPDLIIWLIKDDDLMELNEILHSKIDEIEKNLKESGEYDKLTKAGIPFPAYAKMQEYMNDIYKEKETEIIKLQLNYIAKLLDYYQKFLLIFTLSNTQNKYKKILEEFAKSYPNTYYFENKRNIYDLDGSFEPVDYHPNNKGHRILAEDLFEYLQNSELIPCQ